MKHLSQKRLIRLAHLASHSFLLFCHECFVLWFKMLVVFHWKDTHHSFLVHIYTVQLLIHLEMSTPDGYSMLETVTLSNPASNIMHIVNLKQTDKLFSHLLQMKFPRACLKSMDLCKHSLIWPCSKTCSTRFLLLMSMQVYWVNVSYCSLIEVNYFILGLWGFFDRQVKFSQRWRTDK